MRVIIGLALLGLAAASVGGYVWLIVRKRRKLARRGQTQRDGIIVPLAPKD